MVAVGECINVLIDSRMFEISDQNAIVSNISFFEDVVDLINNGRITVFINHQQRQRILFNGDTPFPLNIGRISDDDQRNRIRNLNQVFKVVLMNTFRLIDAPDCDACMYFRCIPESLKEDNANYELLLCITAGCTDDDKSISDVLVGDICTGGLEKGQQAKVICGCDSKKYQDEIRWTLPYDLFTQEDIARRSLKSLIRDVEIVKKPKVVRAQHHNPLHIGRNYDEVPATMKPVLNMLIAFGLSRINFTDFHHDTGSVGDIVVSEVEKTTQYDIIKGKVYCDAGWNSRLEMFFPSGVGENLRKILGREFEYSKVERLKTRLRI